MRIADRLPLIALYFILLLCSGCRSTAEHIRLQALELGLLRTEKVGTRFLHVLYRNAGVRSPTLHVYIDGDGTPWLGSQPAPDPTPRHSLMLRLLSSDSSSAVYLGRPCYQGTAESPPCSPRLWTKDRYSVEVLESLTAVISQLMAREGFERVAWFGHSGGGTLALLLAHRFPQTDTVVTLAANLDTARWSAYTDQDDLSGSVNPAALPPLPRHIRQRHYVGSKDRIVPPEIAASVAKRQGAPLRIIDGYDHACCWEEAWPSILDEITGKTDRSSFRPDSSLKR